MRRKGDGRKEKGRKKKKKIGEMSPLYMYELDSPLIKS